MVAMVVGVMGMLPTNGSDTEVAVMIMMVMVVGVMVTVMGVGMECW